MCRRDCVCFAFMAAIFTIFLSIEPLSCLDAYTEENLAFRWLNKSRDAPITVKDEHLAELALIDTETLTKYEVYADGE